MIDFEDLLFGPIYDTFAVPGTLTIPSGYTYTLAMIDESAGVEVETRGTKGRKLNPIQLFSTRPCANVRMSELTAKSIALTDLDGSTVVLNGATWKVKAHEPKPGANGPNSGEVRLILDGGE